MDLSNSIAVVTGGGRDIGRACALRLAQAGADVALSFHASSEGAEATVAGIEALGRRGFAMRADLTDPAQVQALVDRTARDLGGLHVVVNNAGGLIARVPLREMSLDHWSAVMDLNLTSTFLVTKAALAHMDRGSIVNLASQAGRDGGGAGASAYAASKGAVMTLTRALAKELGPAIRVNAVCPGMIDTDFHNVFSKPEVRRTVAANTPLKREGTPEDVANLVAWLASDAAAFVTGANVDINGGLAFS